jgi:scyllo-inositol 2-dehydrogenase (NADP+)
VHNKLLGEVHEFEAHYDRYRPKQNLMHGVRNRNRQRHLYDLGAHLIDQPFIYLACRKKLLQISECSAHARTVDNFELTLGYSNKKVILKSGMLVREPGQGHMIHAILVHL